MLNWSLLKNPLNWLTVILMIWIAMFAFHEAGKLYTASAANVTE